MDFLVAGLESGLGLFQFVSERTHTKNTSRSNTAVVQLLEKKLKEIVDDKGPKLELGGRFTVRKFERVGPESDLPGCSRFLLTVTDKDKPGNTITVPVTQAGLPFGGAVLTADSIASASAMMDQHRELLTEPSSEAAHDPLILSLAGYGRNATLMTYRELCLRIEEGTVKRNEDIEQQVCEFIQAQREIRPGFVHSPEQVEQLVIALEDKLKNHLAKSSQLVAPTRIHRSPLNALSHLALVQPSAAPIARIGTSQANLEIMPVEGIALGIDIVNETKATSDVFKAALNNTLGHSKLAEEPYFQSIKRTDRAWSGNILSSAPTQQKHVLIAKRTRRYLPDDIMKYIDRTLTAAAKSGLKSVGFAASLLEPTTPKPGRLGIPYEQMAALAVAAVDRHAASKQISVTFQCTNEAQQAIVDDVIANKEQFEDHQHLQALLRLPNNMPTPIPATAFEDFGDPQKRASFAPVAFVRGPNDTQMFRPAPPLPKFINGSQVPLAPWTDVPATRKDWEAEDKDFDEPKDVDIHAAGVVIKEKDGRVWVVAPTGGFDGMKNTFPKGQIDRDKDVPGEYWSPQATARKEAYEESGLQVKLTGFLFDNKGDSQNTRYYLAERIGGTPADVGWESQAVHLVPKDQLRGMMTWPRNKRENNVLESMTIPHDETGAVTRLEELLCSPDCDVNGKLFEYMAQEVSEAMRYVGQQREVTELVDGKEVHSRQGSRHPQKSTALEIPGATGNAARYLHANRIELDGVSRNFIAAQYPSCNRDMDNRDDFWRAATDSKLLSPIRAVSLIVDLTQPGEKKYDRSYAPPDKEIVRLKTCQLQLTDASPPPSANQPISDSMIQLELKQGGDSKVVQRMHFTEWPDTTAIKVDALIDLASQVNERSNPGDTVLIHCSHGVGRTGTLISFLAASEKITTAIGPGNQLSVADFLGIVREVLIKGREARGEQYVATVQFPLLVKALLKKHFDGTNADGMLIPITPPANIT